MADFRDLLAGDLIQLKLQPSQRLEFGIDCDRVDMPTARALVAAPGVAWTAHAGGRILCCAGFRETFPGVQAVAWAMFAEDLGRHGLAITHYARARVAEAPYRRLEAIVQADNPRAAAWARSIGLEAAHRLECFGFLSEPHILFERIRFASEGEG